MHFIDFNMTAEQTERARILSIYPEIVVKTNIHMSEFEFAIFESNNFELVKLIFNDPDFDLNQKGNYYTPLGAVVYSRNVEFLRLLLEADLVKQTLDLNAEDHNCDPLLRATSENLIEIVRLLLNPLGTDKKREDLPTRLQIGLNCNPNNSSEYWELPLVTAAACGYIEIVQMLLDAGADINAYDSNGGTALTYAVDNDNEEVVELLLSRKELDLNFREMGGNRTAEEIAEKNGNERMMNLFKK